MAAAPLRLSLFAWSLTMPGRMDDNLRRGNNTENLGLHLLRGIGAVAPIPRDQDIGIDAIVTLLDRDDGRRLTAGSTMFVQLKSSSVREITFERDDLAWLQRLELPYFIGSVNSQDSSIALYTIHALCGLLADNVRSATLCLDLSEDCLNKPIETEQEFNEWFTDTAELIDTKVHLGQPVLAWSLNDAKEREFLSTSSTLLEKWVDVFNESQLLQSIGETTLYKWETGTSPVLYSSSGGYRGGDESLGRAVKLFNIALKRVAIEASLRGNVDALQSLLRSVEHLSELGVGSGDVLAAGLVAKLTNKPK
ncbi:MAG: hypothetical protein KDA86_19465 [Planctomycetaceae bacterium]|nr:hypothetical protein [Planctomycetaceae bacterium]